MKKEKNYNYLIIFKINFFLIYKLLLLLEWIEFQKIVPRLASVVVKVINLLSIGFF